MSTLAPIFIPRSTPSNHNTPANHNTTSNGIIPTNNHANDGIPHKDTTKARKIKRKRHQFPIRPFTHIVTPYKKSASPYDRALALYTAAFQQDSPQAAKKREYDSILRSLHCTDPACLVATRSSTNPVFCDSCLNAIPDPYEHYIIPPKKKAAASTSASTKAIPAIARFLSFS